MLYHYVLLVVPIAMIWNCVILFDHTKQMKCGSCELQISQIISRTPTVYYKCIIMFLSNPYCLYNDTIVKLTVLLSLCLLPFG